MRKWICLARAALEIVRGLPARRLYASGPDAFWALVQAAEPAPDLSCGARVRELSEVAFEDFETVRFMFSEPDFGRKWADVEEVLQLMTGCKDCDFGSMNAFRVIAALAYVMQLLKRAGEMEKGRARTDALWIAAGGERLKRYRFLPALIYLGEAFGQLPDTIGALPWLKVFLYLAYKADYQTTLANYQKIKEKQGK